MGGDDAPFAAWADWPSPRCFYHEEWGGADMWIVQDKLVPLVADGTHYIVFWSPGDQVLGEPTHTAKFGVVFGDKGQSEEFSGTAADAGECSLPSQDFYENACRMEPLHVEAWHAACEPFYGVPVPNLYSCTDDSASADHCNTLCHNEGTCLPADAVSCPGDCAETCSYAACPGQQGPLGPACPADCVPGGGHAHSGHSGASHGHQHNGRNLLFGTMPHQPPAHCPPECLGDFHHDHSDAGGEMVESADGSTMCAHDDYACIHGGGSGGGGAGSACVDDEAAAATMAAGYGMANAGCADLADWCAMGVNAVCCATCSLG